MAKKEVTYAEAMGEIEKILARLRNEEMDVDSLAAEVKRATELIASCKGAAAQGRSRREQDFRSNPAACVKILRQPLLNVAASRLAASLTNPTPPDPPRGRKMAYAPEWSAQKQIVAQ